jgi:hypothetical protein
MDVQISGSRKESRSLPLRGPRQAGQEEDLAGSGRRNEKQRKKGLLRER